MRVDVGEAKTNLSKLLARVEAGEDVEIARGDVPRPSEWPTFRCTIATRSGIQRAKARNPVVIEEGRPGLQRA